MRLVPYLLSFLLIAFSACTKQEYITEIDHINQTIDDNVPPPYDGVTSTQIQTYVNKSYIDLLGREPLTDELEAATQALKDGGLETNARLAFVNDLVASSEYYDRFWEIYNSLFLQNVTDDYLNFQILIFTQAYQDAIQSGQDALAAAIQQEIHRFENIRDADSDYRNSLITINELMRRIADNGVYDEINMGSENFVISCFGNFFKRYPTEAELTAGVTMVDGFSSQILTQDGNNKDDFLDIMLHNPEFYQGLVIDIYRQLLSRLPDSIEMGLGTEFLSATGTYGELQAQIMAGEEYAGF